MLKRICCAILLGLALTTQPALTAPWQGQNYQRPIGLWSLSALGAALIADWSAADHGTALMTDDGAGLISLWQDRILGMQLTGTTTQRPTWLATGLNGTAPCLQFDGVGTYLTAANTTGLPSGATPFEIWVVVKTVATGTTTDTFQWGGVTNGSLAQIIKSGSDRINATNGTTTAVVITQSVGVHIFGGIFGASLISGILEGGTFGATTAYTLNTGTTRTRVGASNSNTPAAFSSSCINRILVVSPPQSAFIEEQIAARIAWDAQAQGLLTNSYKNAPP